MELFPQLVEGFELGLLFFKARAEGEQAFVVALYLLGAQLLIYGGYLALEAFDVLLRLFEPRPQLALFALALLPELPFVRRFRGLFGRGSGRWSGGFGG